MLLILFLNKADQYLKSGVKCAQRLNIAAYLPYEVIGILVDDILPATSFSLASSFVPGPVFR